MTRNDGAAYMVAWSEVAAFHMASFLERRTGEQCLVVLDSEPSKEVASARWKVRSSDRVRSVQLALQALCYPS